MPLDGEWDCYRSPQLREGSPPPTPTKSPLLWEPGRRVTSEDDLLRELAVFPLCREIRTLYIIGAHQFQEREIIDRLFPALEEIYLFEPIPQLHRSLVEATRPDQRIRVFPYAIADRNDTVQFHMTSNQASSSLLHLGKHREIFPHVVEVGSIPVECRTLEAVIREFGLAAPDMLFIDVQGAEYQVIAALSPALRSRVKLIYTEASTEELYLGSRPLADVRSLLEPEFIFLGFAPLTNETPTHGNALFANGAVPLAHENRSAADLGRLGEELYGKGNIEGALRAFSQAVAADRNCAEAYNNLAVIYWEKGAKQETIRHLTLALEKNPDYKPAIINTIEVLQSLGHRQSAHAVCLEYLQKYPGDRDISELATQFATSPK